MKTTRKSGWVDLLSHASGRAQVWREPVCKVFVFHRNDDYTQWCQASTPKNKGHKHHNKDECKLVSPIWKLSDTENFIKLQEWVKDPFGYDNLKNRTAQWGLCPKCWKARIQRHLVTAIYIYCVLRLGLSWFSTTRTGQQPQIQRQNLLSFQYFKGRVESKPVPELRERHLNPPIPEISKQMSRTFTQGSLRTLRWASHMTYMWSTIKHHDLHCILYSAPSLGKTQFLRI